MSEEVKILGCNTNFGELQRVFKSRVFVGKKNVRGAYQTRYEAGFYNHEHKIIAWYGSEIPITTIVTARTIAQIRKYLNEQGYVEWELS